MHSATLGFTSPTARSLSQRHRSSKPIAPSRRCSSICYAVAGVTKAASTAAPAPAEKVETKDASPPEYPGPLTVERPPPVDWEDVVLFQAFGWESCNHDKGWWKEVESKIPEIKATGATHVWLPPPSNSVAQQGYLPSQLYNLDSAYGDYDGLVQLNTALMEAGMVSVGDVVINHRCADQQDDKGVWNIFRDDVPHPGRRIDWGPWAITSNDPEFDGRGKRDTGEDFGPSPDLDHTNEEVRAGLQDWMRWLKEYVGFGAWRLDFAKGFAPEITRQYLEATLEVGRDLAVAEYWVDAKWNGSDLDYDQNEMRQRLCDWLNAAKHAAAFDFPTKAILQEAVRHCQYDRLRDGEGKPPGLLGWWARRSVTFVDNHDTGSTQQHWPFPEDGVLEGYAYILTHPGMPCIFWEHYFDWGLKEQLVTLLDLRRRAGIRANSEVEILAAERDMYVAKVGGKVILKMGPRYDMGGLTPCKEEGWKKGASGKNWAVWEKVDDKEQA